MRGWFHACQTGALAVFLLTALASAQTIPFSNQEVTSTAPSATDCTVPPAGSSFLTTDVTVYLFFDATVTSSDTLSNDWLAPDGTVIPGAIWNPQSGTYCFNGPGLPIGNLPPARLGSWQARVYDNGTLLFTVPFAVSPGSSPVGGPSTGPIPK